MIPIQVGWISQIYLVVDSAVTARGKVRCQTDRQVDRDNVRVRGEVTHVFHCVPETNIPCLALKYNMFKLQMYHIGTNLWV